MKIAKVGKQKEGKETQMNLLAVKAGIEAYGIYTPSLWWLYLPAFFLWEGRLSTWSRWSLERSACGSSWPERNFGLAAMMGGGELAPPAPPFSPRTASPALVPCHLKSPQVQAQKSLQVWPVLALLHLSFLFRNEVKPTTKKAPWHPPLPPQSCVPPKT